MSLGFCLLFFHGMGTFKGKDDPVVSCCSFGVAAMTVQVPWANRERWRAPKENLEVADEWMRMGASGGGCRECPAKLCTLRAFVFRVP